MISTGLKAFSQFDRQIFRRNWRKINESPGKKAGLLIRRIAIRSIRKRKLNSRRGEIPSPPGEPPRSRAAGHPYRRIFSVPEAMGTRVIIGPVGFERVGGKTVPELHEFGGTALRRVFDPRAMQQARQPQPRNRRGQFMRARRRRQARRLVWRMVSYPPRPAMRPALAKALPSLPPMWRGSIRAVA